MSCHLSRSILLRGEAQRLVQLIGCMVAISVQRAATKAKNSISTSGGGEGRREGEYHHTCLVHLDPLEIDGPGTDALIQLDCVTGTVLSKS